MEHLSPLDALFVHAEDGVSHMHVGSCAIFAGPAPAFADVRTLLERKLPLLPRYRQKLRFVPGNLAHPVWVDDPDFDLDYHLRHTALPPPGGETELDNLMGRLMSQELDRDRPLWEGWVVEGLSDDRWALISKAHHCMVDGVSGTDMMTVLLDRDPDAALPPPQPWTPSPEPTDAELTVDALRELMMVPMRQAEVIASQMLRPRTALRRAADVAAGLRSLSRFLLPARPLSVEGTIGSHRRYAAARCTLDEIRAIRRALGGSVNDVVLAAISGAFRDVLLARGDRVDGVSFRSLVPVSVRAPDDTTPNNQVSLMIAELPIDIADPVERLAAVREQMAALKASHQIEAGEAITVAAQLTPPLLQATLVRAASEVLRHNPQHNVNTVTTNVPGPQYPLFALGRGMLEYLPFVPLSSGVRIGVAILSYNGHVAFGVTGDYDTARDVREMAERIEAQIHTLHELAGLAAAAHAA